MRLTIMAVGAWVIICGLVSLGVQLGVGVEDILFVQADLGPDAKQEGPKWMGKRLTKMLPTSWGHVVQEAYQ